MISLYSRLTDTDCWYIVAINAEGACGPSGMTVWQMFLSDLTAGTL